MQFLTNLSVPQATKRTPTLCGIFQQSFADNLSKARQRSLICEWSHAMLGFFGLILLATAAIHSTVATPLPRPINLINASSDIPTLTVPGEIDPRFRLIMTSRGTDILSTDSGLMAITKMMHQLAESDFNGVVEPQTYMYDEFPGTSVSIRGLPRDKKVQTRFVVWGIWRVSLYVVQTRIFRDYTFTLTFDNSGVGYIDFTRTQVQLIHVGSSSSNSQNHTQSWDTLPLARRNASSLQSPGDRGLTVPPGRPIHISYAVIEDQDLTKWELFANIYTNLRLFAEFPSRQRIQKPYIVHSEPFPRSRTGFDPKTYPSVLEYRHVAHAFTTIAYYVVTLDILHGIILRIQLNDEVIGQGYIMRLPMSEEA